MSKYTLIAASLFLCIAVGCTSKKATSTVEKPKAEAQPDEKAKKTGSVPTKKTSDPSSSRSLLTGQWKIDLDGFKALEEYKSLSPERQQSAVKLFEQMEMKITFGENKIRMNGHFMGQVKSKVSSYKVRNENEGVLSLETTDADGTTITQDVTVDGNTMKIKEGSRLIVLKRVK